MVASVPFNPLATTNAAGSFNISSAGYIAGIALDDPSIRNALAGGVLSSAETLPLWGGCGITTAIPGAALTPRSNLGPIIRRATNLVQTAALGLTGFSVFNQDHSMLTSPQSPVPVATSGAGVNFYFLGSGARIAVACDPAIASLQGSITSSQVSWDFADQLLVPYTPAYTAVTITNAVWANTSGGQTTFTVGTDLTAVLSAGSDITVSGVINTGGTTTSAFNGRWIVVSVTSTTVVVTQAATSSPGTYASGGTIVAGGGALACKVLDFSTSNSMVPVYNSSDGSVTWNRSGAVAVIQI